LEAVVAVLGALMAGVPVVPIAPEAGPLERRHIITDSGVEIVLNSSQCPVEIAKRADFSPKRPLQADRTAMILYTSGTTGLPKGVQLSAAAIAKDLDLLAEAWEWTPDDVLAHGLPLFHVHGLVLGVLGGLRVGSPVVHTGRPTPKEYASADATLYFGVPTVWSRIALDAGAAEALRSARLLVSGSAGLPAPVFEKLSALCGQGPIERYGMTETLITVSGRARGERRPGWVGAVLAGISTRLIDEEGCVVANDAETVGELEVRTPTLMSGYLNLPEATAACLADDGWFRSGDVASIDPDGWHRIVGRRSVDLIKSGGYRIGAGEVEAALLSHPGVKEAAVLGEDDRDLGQVVVAYVVADDGVSGPELSAFVAELLAVHKRPRRVELRADLPRNAMGKVQKGRLAPS
jgi:fatty acid CoA ligase FadD36